MNQEGQDLHLVPVGDTVSGAAHSPCPNPVTDKDVDSAEAEVTAPPRAGAPVFEHLSPAEMFSAGRQLAVPTHGPRSDLDRYVRMIRPFPTRRLAEIVYHVEADASMVHRLVLNAQVQPPVTADTWSETLLHLLDVLWSLDLRIKDAVPMIETLLDQADTDFERSVSAVTALMRGLAYGE
jgi:hypothetical protein